MALRLTIPVLAVAALVLGACPSRQAQEPAADGSPQQRGLRLFQQGDYDGAIAAYRQALAQHPGDPVLYNLLGMAYRFKYNRSPSPELKQQEIAAFKKAVELKPDFVVALVNLGASYYYSGKKAQAAQAFAKALELAPQHPEAAQLKAMIAEGQAGAEAAPAQSGR